jgi:hypothetical protein
VLGRLLDRHVEEAGGGRGLAGDAGAFRST